MEHKVIIYTDGGSRSNPGPSALGVVIQIGKEKKEYGVRLGVATNNVAEYKAVAFALTKSRELLGAKAKETDIELRTDSELLHRQMLGQYKVKNAGLKPIFAEIQELIKNFRAVLFVHVRREFNKDADRMVNLALDEDKDFTS